MIIPRHKRKGRASLEPRSKQSLASWWKNFKQRAKKKKVSSFSPATHYLYRLTSAAEVTRSIFYVPLNVSKTAPMLLSH
jgi:hypothetical protein